MVIDIKTLKPCHELTKMGKKNYSLFLEQKVDEILFKAQHPLKYYFLKIWDIISFIKEKINFFDIIINKGKGIIDVLRK